MAIYFYIYILLDYKSILKLFILVELIIFERNISFHLKIMSDKKNESGKRGFYFFLRLNSFLNIYF